MQKYQAKLAPNANINILEVSSCPACHQKEAPIAFTKGIFRGMKYANCGLVYLTARLRIIYF